MTRWESQGWRTRGRVRSLATVWEKRNAHGEAPRWKEIEDARKGKLRWEGSSITLRNDTACEGSGITLRKVAVCKGRRVAAKYNPVYNIRKHTQDFFDLSKSYLVLMWGFVIGRNTYPEFLIQFLAYPQMGSWVLFHNALCSCGVEKQFLSTTTDDASDNFRAVELLRVWLYALHLSDAHLTGVYFQVQCVVHIPIWP